MGRFLKNLGNKYYLLIRILILGRIFFENKGLAELGKNGVERKKITPSTHSVSADEALTTACERRRQ